MKILILSIFILQNNFVVSDKLMKDGIEKIRKELFVRLKELRENNKLLEAQRLEQRTMYDIEMMIELGYCSGIENYSRHLDGRKKGQRPFCLLDFFPEDFLMIIDESHVTIPQVKAMYNGDRSRKMSRCHATKFAAVCSPGRYRFMPARRTGWDARLTLESKPHASSIGFKTLSLREVG